MRESRHWNLVLISVYGARGASLLAQTVKNLPAMWETWVWSLGWEDPLEKGKGNPFQYYCLENPMDRGAWRAAVHGVAKSRTRLSNQHLTYFLTMLEKDLACQLWDRLLFLTLNFFVQCSAFSVMRLNACAVDRFREKWRRAQFLSLSGKDRSSLQT